MPTNRDPTAHITRIESPSLRSFWVPTAFTTGLAALALTPRVQANSVLEMSFWTSVILLVSWQLGLFVHLRRREGGPGLDTELRPQHYVQAMVQLVVLGYWGWHWRPVYDMGILIAGQLAFA
jgi:hypothetical protein